MLIRNPMRYFLGILLFTSLSQFGLVAQIQWSEANFIPRNSAELGVADFDQDGHVDIAIAGAEQRWYAGPDFTSFYKIGDSEGGPYAARVADINGDGWMDFISSDGARTEADIPGHIYVYLNPGASNPVTGLWERITVYSGNVRHQNDMRIADLDGDGLLDIIERTWSSERVVVALQNPDINNWTVRPFDTGETGKPEGISAGDIDGDDEMEIVLSGVYWDNPGGWRTGNPIEYPIDSEFVQEEVKSAVGDIDNDGDNDVYMGSAEGGAVYLAWYENTGINPGGGTNFTKHIIKDDFGKCHMVELIDIDQDGDLDLCTGRSFGEKGLLIFYNENDGDSWTEQNYDPSGEIYTGIVADLDADGDLDVVGPSKFYGGQCRYYLNETPVSPPAAPTNFVASLKDGLHIDLTWIDKADNEANYEIERFEAGQWIGLISLPANREEHLDETSQPGTSYQYRLRASNLAGTSEWVLSNTIMTWNQAGAVNITPGSGNYLTPPTISISAEMPFEEIRYTINGATPDENSLLYTGPFVLSNSATIKAIARGNQLINANQVQTVYNIAVNGNFAPFADAGSDSFYLNFDTIYLNASMSFDLDDPNDSLDFYWSQIEGPMVAINQDSSVIANIIPTDNGIYSFLLQVSDEAVSSRDTLRITINNLDSNLVAYWPMDELLDDSSPELINNQDALLGVNMGLNALGGIFGSALELDENNAGAQCPPIDLSGTAMTINLWLNAAAESSVEARFISKASGTSEEDHYWMFSLNGGSALRFRLKTSNGGTTTLVSPGGQINDNSWYMVSAVYDGSSMQIYRNGQLVATTPKTGNIVENDLVALAIGNQPNGAGDRPFVGLLDDIRLYDIALSDTSLLDLYNQGLSFLPVTWLDFQVNKSEQEVLLNWETTDEVDNLGFHIERSRLGAGGFETIGFVAAQNSFSTINQYQFRDHPTDIGKYYYRLRQEDIDGSSSYSIIRSIDWDNNDIWQIFPNPVNNTLFVNTSIDGLQDWWILNSLGQKMSMGKFDGGLIAIPLSNLQNGWFRLILLDGDSKIIGTKSFLKQ